MITLNGTTGITTPDVTSDGSLKINASAPDNSVVVDASGNVGVGTSLPSALLHVSKNETTAYNGSATDGQLTAGSTLFVKQTGGSNNAIAQLAFQPRTGQPYNRIVSSGGSAPYMAFATNNAERARIDSSGNLLVGVSSFTSNNTKFVASTADLSSAITAQNTNASNNNDIVLIRASRNTTGGSYSALSYYNDGAGAYRFKVYDSGNVVNTNNSYGAISDAKLKENVTDATPKLEKLNKVRVVNFNMIGSEQKQIGVIAQELEQIFPSMVDESPDRDAEGNDLGTTTKSVKYSVFVPILIKAIQEQQAIIDEQKTALEALTARVSALEATNV